MKVVVPLVKNISAPLQLFQQLIQELKKKHGSEAATLIISNENCSRS